MSVCKTCGKPKRPSRYVDPETAKELMRKGIDPNSNPDRPLVLDIKDAEAACERIKNGVLHPPCVRSHLSDVCGMEIYLKPECFQYTGAFKERGARNALELLPEDQKKRGVVAASSGNHAQAVSYHGKQMGMKVVVIMPNGSSEMKKQKVLKHGAEVIIHGGNVTEAAAFGLKYAADHDMFYLNGFDHYDVIAGLATVSYEILKEVPNVDVVLMPIGGGGLISGNAKVFKSKNPNIKIYGLQSDRCPSYYESMKNNKRTAVKPGSLTVADGIYVPQCGVNTFATGKDYIDKVLVLDDEFISVAMVRLLEMDKIVAEGAGAIGVAAILAHELDEFKGKTIVSVISGGNVDTTVLCRAVDRGIAAEGRYIKVKCWLPTRIGAVQDFCKLCEENGADIKYVIPETTWYATDVFSQSLKLIIFTRSYDDSMNLKKILDEHYKDVHFEDFKMDREPYPLC